MELLENKTGNTITQHCQLVIIVTVISLPPSKYEPLSGRSRNPKICKRVDLPETRGTHNGDKLSRFDLKDTSFRA